MPRPDTAFIQPSRALALLLAATLLAWWPAGVMATATGPGLSAALADQQQAGSARLRIWGFEVYDASLWTAPGFDAKRYDRGRFALELHYLRRFKGHDIAKRSIDEMRGIGSISPERAGQWLDAMRELFPDVERGDRITGLHVPGSGARFYLNDRLLGEIADTTFARLFFGIWLSPDTSQPGLREALLQRVGATAGGSPAPQTP